MTGALGQLRTFQVLVLLPGPSPPPRQGFLECGLYTTSGTHNDSRRPLGVLLLKLIVMVVFDVY